MVVVFLGGFTSHKKTTDTVTDGFLKVFHSKVVVFCFLWGGVIKKKQVRNFFSKVF